MNTRILLPLALLVACAAPRRDRPLPTGRNPGSFDQRLAQARSVARQGVPSPTPQLDSLAAVLSQTTPELGIAELLSRNPKASLKLRSGDAVQLSIVSHPELAGPHVIDLAGRISILGGLEVVGLTTVELGDRVASKLVDVYQEPRTAVGVTVTEEAVRTVQVVGRVRAHSPGTNTPPLLTTVIPIPPHQRLNAYDLIAAVQGLADDADGTRLCVVRRAPGLTEGPAQVFHFSYQELLQAHVEGREAWLQPDDQLVVPRLPDVFAYGAVQLPGRFPLRPGTTVTSLLLRAGGFSELADEGRILILNGGDERPGAVDELLHPNDVVFIPSSQRVYVVGPGVLRNGPLTLPHQGLSAVQAISEAGWFTPLADMGDVQIQRAEQGRRQVIQVPVSDILEGQALESDYMLQPGDTVYVPEGLW